MIIELKIYTPYINNILGRDFDIISQYLALGNKYNYKERIIF